jgi:hypothetical protein
MAKPAHLHMARELVTFFGLQFSVTDVCPTEAALVAAVVWLRQVQRLAAALAAASHRPSSVHLYSPCVAEGQSAVLSKAGDARVVIHEAHDNRLTSAISAMRHSKLAQKGWGEWTGAAVYFLLKWTALRSIWADAVVLFDMDTEPWPLQLLHPREASIAHWIALLQCFHAQNYSLFSFSDHASPLHGGYFMIKPNATLYTEGLEVMERAAAGGFSLAKGWDGVGRPHDAVPRSDTVWEILTKRRLEMFTRNDWSYVCGSSDQGFFFYMYRVRHQMGADMRFVPACQPEVARRKTPQISHYSAGDKPEKALSLAASTCGPRAEGGIPGPPGRSGANQTLSKLSPFLLQTFARAGRSARDAAWEVGRTLSWARRSQAEVAAMLAALEQQPAGVERMVAIELARRCARFLADGLSCLELQLDATNVTFSDHFARYAERRKRPLPPGAKSIPASLYMNILYKHGADDARPRGPSIYGPWLLS